MKPGRLLTARMMPGGRDDELRIADAAVTDQGDHGKSGAITEMSERPGLHGRAGQIG